MSRLKSSPGSRGAIRFVGPTPGDAESGDAEAHPAGDDAGRMSGQQNFVVHIE
jgi:hypothetical protein